MSVVNRTIDDQNGDEVTGALVTYTPSTKWHQGNGCTVCTAQADPSQALDGTWHDTTHFPDRETVPVTLSFQFTGTAVYLFNILEGGLLTDVNITIDGQFATRFTNTPDLPDSEFVYNVPVFSVDTLPFGEHTVEMSAFGPDQALVLFDYAIYTTTEAVSPPPPPPPSSPSTTSSQQGVQSTSPSSSFAPSSSLSSLPLSSSPLSPLTLSSPSLLSLSSPASTASSLSPSATPSGTPPSSVGNVAAPTSGSSTASSTATSPVQTTNDAAVRSSHQANIAALAGGITGGVFLILTLLLVWLWYLRRHRKPELKPEFNASRSSSGQEPLAQDRLGSRYPSMSAHPSEASRLHIAQHASPVRRSAASVVPSLSRSISQDDLEDDYTYSANSVIAVVASPSSLEHHGPTARLAPDNGLSSILVNSKSTTFVAANARSHDAHSLRAEIERLRAQQHLHQQSLATASASGLGSTAEPTSLVELQRQIELLRTEMERIRMQQDLETESPPSYSPHAPPILRTLSTLPEPREAS
ncbi:hypothetical protein BDW22DRAFT_1425072 [Trametopsis cervina]|nr:hypothetical protein BDW22DRAFT_1425072 [Trametopsis cervina]